MYDLSIENTGKKIVIILKDHLVLREAEQLFAKIEKSIPKLSEGFIVLTDLSSLERMDTGARLFIEKIMDLLNKNGVSKVVRIIPDKERDVGFNIMSLFHYSDGVAIHTCKSYEEAEKYFR